MSKCDETIREYLQRTYNSNPHKRKQALKDLCPCHVRADIPELWERIFEMLSDEEGKLATHTQLDFTLLPATPCLKHNFRLTGM